MDEWGSRALHPLLHRGLRARLGAVLELFGRTDWRDPAAGEDALAELGALLAQLDAHEESEDRVLHVAMERCQAGASAATAEDHRGQAAARTALRGDAQHLRGLPPARRASAAARLERRLALYLADWIEHMLCEELESLPFLRARLGQAALTALERAALAALPGGLREQLVAWTLPTVTAEEGAWLRQVSAACAVREVGFRYAKGLAA